MSNKKTKRKVVIYVGILAGGFAAANLYLAKRGVHRGNGGDVSHGGGSSWQRNGATRPIHRPIRQATNRRTGGGNRIGPLAYVGLYARAVLGIWIGVLTTVGWWAPINDLLNFFGGAVNWIVDMVGAAIDTVIDFVNGLINAVYGFVYQTIWLINTSIQLVSNFAQNIWNYVLYVANTLIHDVVNAASWFLTLAINAVHDFAQWIYTILYYLIAQALNWIGQFPAWIWNNVLGPLWHLINTVGDLIWQGAMFFYNLIVKPVLDYLGSILSSVANFVAQLWDWFTKYAVGAVELVLKCVQWLEWFAVHSFEDIAGLILSAEGNVNVHSIEGWVRSEAGNFEAWTQDAANWLGV